MSYFTTKRQTRYGKKEKARTGKNLVSDGQINPLHGSNGKYLDHEQ